MLRERCVTQESLSRARSSARRTRTSASLAAGHPRLDREELHRQPRLLLDAKAGRPANLRDHLVRDKVTDVGLTREKPPSSFLAGSAELKDDLPTVGPTPPPRPRSAQAGAVLAPAGKPVRAGPHRLRDRAAAGVLASYDQDERKPVEKVGLAAVGLDEDGRGALAAHRHHPCKVLGNGRRRAASGSLEARHDVFGDQPLVVVKEYAASQSEAPVRRVHLLPPGRQRRLGLHVARETHEGVVEAREDRPPDVAVADMRVEGYREIAEGNHERRRRRPGAARERDDCRSHDESGSPHSGAPTDESHAPPRSRRRPRLFDRISLAEMGWAVWTRRARATVSVSHGYMSTLYPVRRCDT